MIIRSKSRYVIDTGVVYLMDQELIRRFLEKRNIFAVIGASKNPNKYGHQVYRDLRSAGYTVYPVNPNADEILGDKCYPNLESLPVQPDVADLVVPPEITEKVVRACKSLDVRKVWMQPGSESEESINFCEHNGIEVVHGVCVMIERRAVA